jgi:hypothetical protein
MRATDAAPVMTQRMWVSQARTLTALREWLRMQVEERHITSADITRLLKAQGVDRRRRPDPPN